MDKKLLKVGIISFFLVTSLLCGCAKKGKESVRKVNLRFENWEVTPEQLSIWKEITDKFNQGQSKIHVELQPVQGGTQKIITEMAGGVAPDIFFWDTNLLTPLATKGAVLDLTSLAKKNKIEQSIYYPIAWNGCSIQDKLYGLPCYWGTDAIAYNKDIFDRGKVSYPNDNWTWNDFLKTARKLTKEEGGRVIQYGCTPPDNYHIVTQFGGSWFNEKGEFTADSPEAVKALTFLHDLRYKYHVAPSLASLPPDFYRGEIDFFMTGRVAMFRANAFVIPVLKKIKQFRWDVAALPKTDGKRTFQEGSGILCISSQSTHPEEAFDFVKFACGKEGQAILAKGGNCIPALKEVAEKSFAPPPKNIGIYISQVENTAFSPRRFSWYQNWDAQIRRPEMDKLMIDKQTAEKTVKNIKEKTNLFFRSQIRTD